MARCAISLGDEPLPSSLFLIRDKLVRNKKQDGVMLWYGTQPKMNQLPRQAECTRGRPGGRPPLTRRSADFTCVLPGTKSEDAQARNRWKPNAYELLRAEQRAMPVRARRQARPPLARQSLHCTGAVHARRAPCKTSSPAITQSTQRTSCRHVGGHTAGTREAGRIRFGRTPRPRRPVTRPRQGASRERTTGFHVGGTDDHRRPASENSQHKHGLAGCRWHNS